MMSDYSWHDTRDGLGPVLGPYDETLGGHPYLARGLTLEQAEARFPGVKAMGPVPITVDKPRKVPADLTNLLRIKR